MDKTLLLDHGYVQFIESWGSDERIIEAARMSVNKGFQGWGTRPDCEVCLGTGKLQDQDDTRDCTAKCVSGDEKLLKYLYNNKHMTPFEMAGMVIEVQAPIMVYREWHRHRTQSYNEMSARYTPLPDLNYIPTIERLMINAGASNKQAGTIKDSEELTEERAAEFQEDLRREYAEQERLYRLYLSRGVPKELARLPIAVGRYSRMRASANLRNWLAFLTLRQASGAQWEIRQYANAVADYIQAKFPRTYALYAGSGK